MCIDSIAPYITLGKEVVVALATVVGVWYARQGLNTWRRQLKGTHEFELARRLAVDLYQMRDAIQNVRNPILFVGETELPEEVIKKVSPELRDFFGIERAYENRWEKVKDARKSLAAKILEAEALWGGDIREKFSEIWKCQNELNRAIRLHLLSRDPRLKEEERMVHSELFWEKPDVLYMSLSEEDGPDEFTEKITEAVGEAEEALKPYLRH